MSGESQIPTASAARRFAGPLALVYSTGFGLVGTHLPYFPLWLKAVGVDASWIGIITAVPAVTRFTVLPFVTGFAERRHALRGAIMVTAFATVIGLAITGTQHLPLLILIAYAATCCLWTPMVPLIDAYALRGVTQYGLKYGPLRLWGSAAFIATALACGQLLDVISASHLIWLIVGMASLGALVSLTLQPLGAVKMAPISASRRWPAAARWRLPRHHPHLGADPEQPSGLLHLRLHRLAAGGFRWPHHRGPVGARRARRDRGVRGLAAIYAAARDAGGDISARQRSRAG